MSRINFNDEFPSFTFAHSADDKPIGQLTKMIHNENDNSLRAEFEQEAKEQPTDEGKRRHDPDGYYEGSPCTCSVECLFACKGECGCAACRKAYADFLSEER